MKKITVMIGVFLLLVSNVFADDVQIDSSGNIKTGVASTGNLDVTGASAEKAIVGQSSGTGGAGVYGINTTSGNYGYLGWDSYGVYGYNPTGWAGYFQGNARVTGNLTIDGSILGPVIGDITGVTAGTGLSGGGTSGDVTLDVNTAVIQQRVTGTCAAGSSISTINADGTVVCEPDDGSTGVSGSGAVNYIPRWTGTSSLGDSAIYQDSSGNVGIGTTSLSSGKLQFSNDLGNKIVVWNDGGADHYGIGLNSYNLNVFIPPAARFSIRHNGYNGSEVFTVKGDGKVGIGTTTPSQKLTVAGTIESTSGGVKFPDGSTQTTACTQALCVLYRSAGIHPPAECFSQISDTGQTADYTSIYGEDSDYSIRPQSYTDNGNGTVTDNVSGLMWQQQDNDTTYEWAAAITYCNDLPLGGYSDWRLPDEFELMGIVNYGSYVPAINTIYFPNTDPSSYWSSTTYAYDPYYVWYVNFRDGVVYKYGKYDYFYVRCVRGGQ